MAPITRVRFVGGLLAAAFLTASSARAASRERAVIVVHVENHAQVSSRVLGEAERVVDRIYASAGIRVVWADQDAQTERTAAPLRHLRVLILSREMTDTMTRTDDVPENVVGQAQHPVGRAYVLYPRLEDIATRKWVYITDLLGKVIAHEMGHLLLNTGHSPSGIMRPGLELRPVSQERFTVEEIASLQAGLSSGR